MATTKEIIGSSSDGNRRGDMRVALVIEQLKIVELEIKDGSHVRIDLHLRQRKGLARKLQSGLVQMVEVEMGIAKGVDEVTGLVAGHLGHHHGQQGVGGDVERHAQKDVGAALVKLAGELAVGDVKLEHGVAGRQGHAVDVGHIPGADDVAAGIGIFSQAIDQVADLVVGTAVRSGQERHW